MRFSFAICSLTVLFDEGCYFFSNLCHKYKEHIAKVRTK